MAPRRNSCPSIFATRSHEAHLESYGYTVIHDTTDHEPPKLTTAYDRSLATIEQYKEKYPEIEIFIDVHRDSLGLENMENDVVEIDGKRCAKVMFVVGQGQKYDDKPDFDTNNALAENLTSKLNGYAKGLCKAPRIRTGRYNQQVGKYCMLIEVGSFNYIIVPILSIVNTTL